MSDAPRTWAEMMGRFAVAFGGHDGEAAAQEWIAQAVEATWGSRSLYELTAAQRQLAFQRTASTWYAMWELIYDEPACTDLAFYPEQRALVARAFAMRWQGAALEGPPWRLSPTEPERPTYDEWAAGADFG